MNAIIEGPNNSLKTIQDEIERYVQHAIERFVSIRVSSNLHKSDRYWYPLSMPTYGVREIMEALDSMCSFQTSMSAKTRRFERQFAEYQGCADGVFCNSGSSADLLLAFLLTDPRCRKLQPGDEVLVPVVTWPTHIWSVMMAGLKPVFVDVDPTTLNICLDDLKAKITERSRAIFLVHLMGNPCNMDYICDLAREHGLEILEDCCEALGSEWDGIKVGNFGLAGSYSFFFSHHMMTMEGGMISARDVDIADRLRILRAHGWVRNSEGTHYDDQSYKDIDPRYAFVNWGFNLRPTEVQSAFGIHQLEKLPAMNARRVEKGEELFKFLEQYRDILMVPTRHPKAHAVWFAIPMVLTESAPFTVDDFKNFLESHGVETRPLVTGNILRHPVREVFPDLQIGSFKGADIVHSRGFYIGLTPMQSDSNFDRLKEILSEYLNPYLGGVHSIPAPLFNLPVEDGYAGDRA